MNREELIDRYLGVVRYYGCLFGIWPFDKSWKRHLLPRLMYLWCITALISITAKIVVHYSFNVLTDQIPFICVALIASAKHANCFLKLPKFGEILTNMIHDWQEEKTKEETDIVTAYAEKGVLYALLYNINIYFAVFAFATVPFIPRILDLIVPLNESRPRLYAYEGYYYFDPNDYYYIIVAYNSVTAVLAGIVLISSDIIMIHLVQHACGLLILAGHRFKYAMDDIEYSPRRKRIMLRDSKFRRLRVAFLSHNRATQHLLKIESVYAINLVLQLFITIMSFSLTLYKTAIQEVSPDMCKVYAFLIAQIVHMLFLTIQGQFVLDSHDVVYRMIYESFWYEEIPKLQLLYVIALRRSLTPPILTAGGLMRLDLNSFAELIKVCISYYTVLKSS